MQERMKQIQAKFLEFWNKYTSKQKTIIICVIAAVFFLIVLLTYFLTIPRYDTQLASLEDNKRASELVKLLEENGILCEQSRDGTVVYVQEKDYTSAINLMADNDILSDDFDWSFAFENSMSTTESEKEQKRTLATQSDLRKALMKYQGVKDANVTLYRPDSTYTIFDESKEASVSIMLTLSEEMTKAQAKSLASYVANAVGNSSTDNIVIMDQNRSMLFGGDSDDMLGGEVSDKEEYKEKLRNTMGNNVEAFLLAYGFDMVTVGCENIKFNFDEIEERYAEYTTSEGQEQGLYSSSYEYSSQGSSGSGGVPGTSSNGDETDYLISNGSSSDSKVTLNKYDYLPNETIKNIKKEIGAVDPESSSMAVVATRYKIYNEVDLERQGLLEDMSFDDFKDVNNVRNYTEDNNAEIVSLVSAMTGIDEENISVVTWEVPIFNAKEKGTFDINDYLMIILAVLIIALLVFVVFRGTAPVEVTEVEPELSVEQLLATTKDNQSLDDIEFSEKSETRKMIEKFVDENPEAVANLLRNWLQEDWG